MSHTAAPGSILTPWFRYKQMTVGLGVIKNKVKVLKEEKWNCFTDALPKAFVKMQPELVVKGRVHPCWYPRQ